MKGNRHITHEQISDLSFTWMQNFGILNLDITYLLCGLRDTVSRISARIRIWLFQTGYQIVQSKQCLVSTALLSFCKLLNNDNKRKTVIRTLLTGLLKIPRWCQLSKILFWIIFNVSKLANFFPFPMLSTSYDWVQKVNILGTVKRTNLAYTLLSEENSRKILSKRWT